MRSKKKKWFNCMMYIGCPHQGTKVLYETITMTLYDMESDFQISILTTDLLLVKRTCTTFLKHFYKNPTDLLRSE